MQKIVLDLYKYFSIFIKKCLLIFKNYNNLKWRREFLNAQIANIEDKSFIIIERLLFYFLLIRFNENV